LLDERFTRSLHVETMRREGLLADVEPHVLFQSSTIGALLEGRYEGDVTLGELGAHGDLGLGTLDHLDGELIAIDGAFYRADVDGRIEEVPPEARTPFAVLVSFAPTISTILEGPRSQAQLLAAIEGVVPRASAYAIRVDGRFESLHLRSVPRQDPPYRPLADVVADQHVFDLGATEGTLVGFRFPDHGESVEVPGFHLHFISADRRRGGHVLDLRTAKVEAQLDVLSSLHVELPPGVELEPEHLDGDPAELARRVEHDG
jgi:acetolactate decarboxylase